MCISACVYACECVLECAQSYSLLFVNREITNHIDRPRTVWSWFSFRLHCTVSPSFLLSFSCQLLTHELMNCHLCLWSHTTIMSWVLLLNRTKSDKLNSIISLSRMTLNSLKFFFHRILLTNIISNRCPSSNSVAYRSFIAVITHLDKITLSVHGCHLDAKHRHLIYLDKNFKWYWD